MNKIIGSERIFDSRFLMKRKNSIFEDLYPEKRINCLSSGRSAIKALFEQIFTPKRLLAPDFNCIEVMNALNNSKAAFDIYPIRSNFCADLDILKKLTDAKNYDSIYIVDYFGLRDSKLFDFAKRSGLKIIIDRTHSLFNKHKSFGDYELGSLSKLFPVPDGGFLVLKSGESVNISKSVSDFCNIKLNSKVKKFVYNKYFMTSSLEAEYLQDSEKAEKMISDKALSISPFSKSIIDFYDIEKAAAKRIRNRNILLNLIDNSLIASFSEEIMQSLPLFIPQRDRVKLSIQKNKVFLPILWRGSKDFQQMLINLPIDEEYSAADMNRIAGLIQRALNAD